MGLAYATRPSTFAEDQTLRLLLSTFRDGSGNERERDQSTRANWRQMERCFAELLGGIGGEDKGIFDLVALDHEDISRAYGFSIKSKQLSRSSFNRLASASRVYMEVANSPAKFWSAIKRAHGYEENDFRSRRYASEIGNTLLQAVAGWHAAGKVDFEKRNIGATLDLEQSRYLCLSYSDDEPDARKYQVHAFALGYPDDAIWRYTSDACLTAYDPAHPDERLIDWYGLSGGQLKYYPRGASAVYQSTVFSLLKPAKRLSILEKAKMQFPEEFP